MNHSESRPVLPGTTPAPGPAGLRNVYASKSPPPPPAEVHSQFHAPSANTNNQKALLEKTVNKIVSKLPFQLRESVTAVITMAMTSAENVQKDLDICYHEIAVLRSDLNKKTSEAKILKKHCTLYEERARSLEENIEVLRDNIDSRQKFSIKNRSAMTRLSSTNRMLIDALDALQSNTKPGTAALLSKPPGTMDMEARDRPGLLVPISKKPTKETQHQEYEETEQKLSMFQNDKLRESLLRVAREHYRSMKNAEMLDSKVVELRAALRAQEQANRKLKSELDEVKILLNADTAGAAVEVAQPTDTTNVRNFQFGALDTRFKVRLPRFSVNVTDTSTDMFLLGTSYRV
jgi:chromosome segregation ATPase